MGYAKLSMRRRLMMVTTSGGAIFVHVIGRVMATEKQPHLSELHGNGSPGHLKKRAVVDVSRMLGRA